MPTFGPHPVLPDPGEDDATARARRLHPAGRGRMTGSSNDRFGSLRAPAPLLVRPALPAGRTSGRPGGAIAIPGADPLPVLQGAPNATDATVWPPDVSGVPVAPI